MDFVNTSSTSHRLAIIAVIGCTIAVCTGAILAWLVPVEVAQTIAVNRANDDEFSRFEAFEAATAAVWLTRVAMTIGAMIMMVVGFNLRRIAPALTQAMFGSWSSSGYILPPGNSWRTRASRIVVAAWLMMAMWQAAASVQRRLWEWPVYRLSSGQSVLPNISSSNREVIRYLEAVTPPGSRVLVLSDQKLFFLSYYLLPRRVYHPTHPDSEFVIAQAYNERQLAAYRLDDLPPDRVQRVNPDFILEYFEGAEFLQGEDLNQDHNWIRYQHSRLGPTWRPSYLVRLRPYDRQSS